MNDNQTTIQIAILEFPFNQSSKQVIGEEQREILVRKLTQEGQRRWHKEPTCLHLEVK